VDDNYPAHMLRGLTARQLVEELGPTLFRLTVDGPGADRPLSGVVIHDPVAGGHMEQGCVVLGVGVATSSAVAELASAADEAGACAIVVKGPLPARLDGCALAVVEVNRDASWMHVASMVRERLLDHSRAQLQPDGAVSDLFTIANTISVMLQAPVTIEDRSSAVLAWSAGQREADEARVESILGRAVQRRWLDELQSRGVFTQLHTSTAPVYVDPVAPGMLPRVALAVRAGADVVGYVWAAVPGPLPDELSRQLGQIAPIVALHLVNTRAESTWARQQRSELAATVLAGGSAGVEAAQQLHLPIGPLCVLAAGRRADGSCEDSSPGHDAAAAAELLRFSDAMALHLAAVHPSAVTVRSNQEIYALLAWPRATPRQALDSSCSLARDFLARSQKERGWVIAVGGPAESVTHVPRARTQADAALRALRHQAGRAAPVAALDDVALEVMLLNLADITDSLGLPDTTGPLSRLTDHDGAHGVLVSTLAAHLAAAGVAEDAAAALQIHVNTLRYRLRRIREISGLDFGDANAMLLAQLQLRLKGVRPSNLDANDESGGRSSS
jgi:hypothetical protein